MGNRQKPRVVLIPSLAIRLQCQGSGSCYCVGVYLPAGTRLSNSSAAPMPREA